MPEDVLAAHQLAPLALLEVGQGLFRRLVELRWLEEQRAWSYRRIGDALVGQELAQIADPENRPDRGMRRGDRHSEGGCDQDRDRRRERDAKRPDGIHLGDLLADRADQLRPEQRQSDRDADRADQQHPEWQVYVVRRGDAGRDGGNDGGQRTDRIGDVVGAMSE